MSGAAAAPGGGAARAHARDTMEGQSCAARGRGWLMRRQQRGLCVTRTAGAMTGRRRARAGGARARERERRRGKYHRPPNSSNVNSPPPVDPNRTPSLARRGARGQREGVLSARVPACVVERPPRLGGRRALTLPIGRAVERLAMIFAWLSFVLGECKRHTLWMWRCSGDDRWMREARWVGERGIKKPLPQSGKRRRRRARAGAARGGGGRRRAATEARPRPPTLQYELQLVRGSASNTAIGSSYGADAPARVK